MSFFLNLGPIGLLSTAFGIAGLVLVVASLGNRSRQSAAVGLLVASVALGLLATAMGVYLVGSAVASSGGGIEMFAAGVGVAASASAPGALFGAVGAAVLGFARHPA